MSIKKYKTFEEAEKELWVMEPDNNYYKKILKLFDNRIFSNVKKLKKGVFKYKTFEEAEKDRFECIIEKEH